MKEIGTNLEFLKLAVPALIVVIGWGAIHCFSQMRDLENKRKEMITAYIVEAYRNIEDACGRGSRLADDQKRRMEKAIADIQLFGSIDEIKAAKEFAETMNNSSYGDPRKLLATLRNDLRRELKLPEASSNPDDIIHWRLQ